MNSIFRPAFVLFGVLTLVTGVAYPLVVTGLSKVAFADQASGSLVTREGKVVGSTLIGQTFADPKNFWGRPSATSPMSTNGTGSSGSNQGPTNTALTDAVKARIAALRASSPGSTLPIPVDLVTASASGLDPTSASRARSTRCRASRRLDTCRSARSARSWKRCRKDASSAFSASRASTCWR